MLLWISREASITLTSEQRPNLVPFQNLEDEFSSWSNVQAYLNQNVVGIYTEVQNMVHNFPLAENFIEMYLHKI